MPANISARLATVAADRYDRHRAVLCGAADGVDKVALRYLRDKATTKAAVAVARAQVLPQAPAPHALREPQGQGLRIPASSANKALVNQRRARGA